MSSLRSSVFLAVLATLIVLASCKSLNVTVYQGNVVFGNKTANVEIIAKFAKLAKQQGAQVVVFPELFLCGYYAPPSQLEILQMIEPSNGPYINMIKSIAAAEKIALAVGYAEAVFGAGGIKLYDSVVFIDDNGVIKRNQRKVHLTNVDAMFFSRGERLGPVIKYKGFTLAIAICQDLYIVETGRELALQGAEVILNPAAITLAAEDNFSSNVTIRSRAFENGLFIAHSNYIANYQNFLVYQGLSRVLDTLGKDLDTASASYGPSRLLFGTFEINADTWTSQAALAERVAGAYPHLCKKCTLVGGCPIGLPLIESAEAIDQAIAEDQASLA